MSARACAARSLTKGNSCDRLFQVPKRLIDVFSLFDQADREHAMQYRNIISTAEHMAGRTFPPPDSASSSLITRRNCIRLPAVGDSI